MKIFRLPRWVHRVYAETFGYFWLPCFICGEYMGGHEWGHGLSFFPAGSDVGFGVCPSCARAYRSDLR